MQMTLRSSPSSPFGRKVLIAAGVLGMGDRIAVEKTDVADPADTLRTQNPIGKIPVLLVKGAPPLFDSRVIVEYLDHLAGGGRILPADPGARFVSLRLQALSDGVADASLLLVYEGRYRSADKHEPRWVAYQAAKVERALAVLEAEPPADPGPVPDVGQIALACALGYRDLRFPGTWRDGHPRLVAWLDRFAERVPSFAATHPPG